MESKATIKNCFRRGCSAKATEAAIITTGAYDRKKIYFCLSRYRTLEGSRIIVNGKVVAM
jgi:hypothetical protein